MFLVLKKLNKIDLTIVSISAFFLVSKSFLKCQNFVGLDFDSQSFIYWDFTSALGLIPYKDFFYPYGIFYFFKIDSFITSLFEFVIIFVILFATFKILERFTETKILLIISFILYVIFSYIFIEISSLSRYGSLIPLIYYLYYICSKNIYFSKKSSIITGFLLGLLFSFNNDIFFYGLILYLISTIIYYKKKPQMINVKIFNFSIYTISGLLFGVSILFTYLMINDAISPFIQNYKLIFEISNFAKVPFPPSLKVFENLFNIGIIIFSLIYLIQGKNLKKENLIILLLFLTMILLEQKNIIRSIYGEISIFGMLLFIIFLLKAYSSLIKYNLAKGIGILYITSLIVLLQVIIFMERPNVSKTRAQILSNQKCYDTKLNELSKNDTSEYYEVKNELNGARIFSFPGDPVFYAIFDQRPPFYPSTYESTPEFAQDKQISYINEYEVEYIIFNTKNEAIQDGVPDRIRNKKLYEYINNNFTKDQVIGQFLILKRN